MAIIKNSRHLYFDKNTEIIRFFIFKQINPMEIILSSAKKGYGLNELLNTCKDEFWSTDDTLPHSITINFPKKTYIHSLGLLLSFSLDESYTPENLVIYFNKKSIKQSFREPEGEKAILIDDFVFDIYIVITSNHSDGKDSHIRGLNIKSSPTEIIQYTFNNKN